MSLFQRFFGYGPPSDIPAPHVFFMQVHDGKQWHTVQEVHPSRAVAMARQDVWQSHVAAQGWTQGVTVVKPLHSSQSGVEDMSFGGRDGVDTARAG